MNTLTEHVSCVTPAGGGGNITGTVAAPTSLEACTSGAGNGVSAPPTADDLPPEVSADEIGLDEIFDIELGDDDSDEKAYPRSRRLICSTSSDGQTTIHRFGSVGIALTAEETRDVYEFLANSARIWGGALP